MLRFCLKSGVHYSAVELIADKIICMSVIVLAEDRTK